MGLAEPLASRQETGTMNRGNISQADQGMVPVSGTGASHSRIHATGWAIVATWQYLHGTMVRNRISHIPVELIRLPRFTLDVRFPEVGAPALALARESGIIAPVTVRQIENPGFPQYELLSGKKSWAIAQHLLLPTLPALVFEGLTDAEARAYVEIYDQPLMALSQGDRVQHGEDPLAWADSAMKDIEDKRRHNPNYSQKDAARSLGLDHTTLSHALRMVRTLRPAARAALSRRRISLGHAKALTAFQGLDQDLMVQRIILHKASVRTIEEAAAASRTGRAVPISYGVYRRDLELVRLEGQIEAVTGVPVSIEYDKKTSAGRVILEFANPDVFDGILARIGVPAEDS